MKRVLVTGMSGTGKSTVINELAARGYKAVDTDDHGLSEWVAVRLDEPTGLGPGQDWVWREDRIQDLLSADDADVLFLSGCSTGWPMAGLERLAAGRREPDAHPYAVRGAQRCAVSRRQDRVVSGPPPRFAFVTVGAVVVSRRPGNVIGWLCCGIGLAQILAGFGGSSARSVLAADPSYGPGWVVLYSLGELCWELSWALLALLLLVFPTGRLPSRRWRPVAWAAGAVLVLAALSSPLLPGPPADGLRPNPIAFPALEGVLRLAYNTASSVLFVVILAALVSLIVRFRRATGAERQQLKWFTYGTALLLLLPVAGLVGAELPDPAGDLAAAAILSALPVTIGIAVLRYRLYDIDRLVNRTVVYGLLTVLLAGVYAGLVFALSQLLNPGDQQSALAVAASTLVVAALFQPARRRIQGLVDRRFNRRRYDAARTVAAFSARLRDQVELGTLSTELLVVVDQTMQPTQASLWLRPTQPPSGRSERR